MTLGMARLPKLGLGGRLRVPAIAFGVIKFRQMCLVAPRSTETQTKRLEATGHTELTGGKHEPPHELS